MGIQLKIRMNMHSPKRCMVVLDNHLERLRAHRKSQDSPVCNNSTRQTFINHLPCTSAWACHPSSRKMTKTCHLHWKDLFIPYPLRSGHLLSTQLYFLFPARLALDIIKASPVPCGMSLIYSQNTNAKIKEEKNKRVFFFHSLENPFVLTGISFFQNSFSSKNS